VQTKVYALRLPPRHLSGCLWCCSMIAMTAMETGGVSGQRISNSGAVITLAALVLILSPQVLLPCRCPLTATLVIPIGREDGHMTRSSGAAGTSSEVVCILIATISQTRGRQTGQRIRRLTVALVLAWVALMTPRLLHSTAMRATRIGRRAGLTERRTGAAKIGTGDVRRLHR